MKRPDPLAYAKKAKKTGEKGSEATVSTLASSKAKAFYATVGVMVVAVVALYLMAQSRGIVNTIVYAFIFLFCATFFPVIIGLAGSMVPNSVGKLHMILGAVAFNTHYLVQRENKWEWCPGERERYWLDGEWHEIEGGFENYTVLGWRPFGVLRHKADETWAEQRVDTKSKKLRGVTETDGGAETVERAGIQEVDPPIRSGIDGTWVVDLKRVASRGVKKIGDIDVIENAEEVIERGEIGDGRLGSVSPLVENIAMLLLGVLTGFVYVLIA